MLNRSIPIAVVALHLVAGCGAAGLQVPTAAANLVLPPDQEAALAERVDQELHRQLDVIEDPAVRGYVQQVGHRVAQASAGERGPVDVHFEVVDDPDTVNAFAAVGGNIYVYTGLLLAVRNEAELASVLAHEVAHVANRDIAKLLTAQMGLSTLAQVAVGANPNALQQIVTQLAGAGAIAAHTRDQERRADTLGVRYLAAAGYDPRAMIGMYETLGRLREQNPGLVQAFFATHPQTEDRIAAISEEIRQMGPTRGTLGREQYAQFAQHLQRRYGAGRIG